MANVSLVDEVEFFRMEQTKRSTEALLLRLREHHDYSVVPPENWRAQPEPVSAPDKAPEQAPPSKPLWFGIVDEESRPEPRLTDIKRAACRYFDITLAELLSHRRTTRVVYPRQISFYVAKTMTGKSLPEIGRRFGDKDHTTVLHGIRKIESLVRKDWRVAYDVAAMEARCEIHS